ncbi:phytanoyl-CoA dioxygenase family protein [Sneathiella aquimaris]|uniref:phytanoyl-CoA dioxygenase family protein n=1 Tax=Sneathiella aquimaris TaxID=2599305 RepID=UPI00146CF7A4|nr:phytanoyl-CoA dioxygenase family protein [Sneathiella aquimaris]
MSNLSKKDWESLCPELTIEEAYTFPQIDFSDDRLDDIATGVWGNGFIHEKPVFSQEQLHPLLKALTLMQAKGIPPVYIYVFDQPWYLFKQLNQLIGHFLGDEYALLPNLWAWYFDAPGERGWRPHQDCHLETVFDLGGDKMLMSLSLWIPLTDCTEENGCMFVLPREKEHVLRDNPEMEQALLEPYAQPLPAAAGSVLGWPQDLVHWGGTFKEGAVPPRASLSLEFQNTAFDPLVAPFLDAGAPPVFQERLSLIQGQYEKYKHIVSENEVSFFAEK